MVNELGIVRDVSFRLEKTGIEYMLTGSMAMNYYSQPRMTRNIDVVVALSHCHVDVFLSSFHPDYYVTRETVESSLRQHSMFNLVHMESIIKVDCIIRKTSDYRLHEFERWQRISIEDFSTWIVSKEDLILSKLDWAKDSHSELQIRDIKSLNAAGFDEKYIQNWIHSLGLVDIWKVCLHD